MRRRPSALGLRLGAVLGHGLTDGHGLGLLGLLSGSFGLLGWLNVLSRSLLFCWCRNSAALVGLELGNVGHGLALPVTMDNGYPDFQSDDSAGPLLENRFGHDGRKSDGSGRSELLGPESTLLGKRPVIEQKSTDTRLDIFWIVGS